MSFFVKFDGVLVAFDLPYLFISLIVGSTFNLDDSVDDREPQRC